MRESSSLIGATNSKSGHAGKSLNTFATALCQIFHWRANSYTYCNDVEYSSCSSSVVLMVHLHIHVNNGAGNSEDSECYPHTEVAALSAVGRELVVLQRGRN